MSKRSAIIGYHLPHKKRNTHSQSMRSDYCSSGLPTNTESALLFLKDTFPIEKFKGKLPPVLLVHQVYSILECKTTVDKEIRELQSKGTIRLFKLGGEETACVVIYSEDLHNHILENCPSKPVISLFLNSILNSTQDMVIEKSVLRETFGLTENCISELMNAGLLTLRTLSSFWFSFPNAGEFMKTYLRGRKSVIRSIKKSKFSEILQFELEQRKLEKLAKLGMKYHIHDIIGAELVQWLVALFFHATALQTANYNTAVLKQHQDLYYVLKLK